jgi:hypothetical protein
MSSSTYYVRRQLAEVEGQLAACSEVLVQIEAMKRQIRSTIAAGARRHFERVADVASAEVTVAGLAQADLSRLTAGPLAAPTATRTAAVDFSHLLTPAAPADLDGYLDEVEQRVKALFPLTEDDDAQVADLLSEVAAARADGIPLAQARFVIEPKVEALATRLREAETALIEDAYLTYLSVCAVAGVSPRRLGLLELQAETARLTAQLDRQQRAQTLQRAVHAALEEVGLKLAGGVVLNQQSGQLVTADGDDRCALFLVEGEDSLLFTTVVAELPAAQSVEERLAATRSMERFCARKHKLVDEILARQGIVLDTGFDWPAQLDQAVYSPDFARLVERRRTGDLGRTAADRRMEA